MYVLGNRPWVAALKIEHLNENRITLIRRLKTKVAITCHFIDSNGTLAATGI
jgi:hypothetical protein